MQKRKTESKAAAQQPRWRAVQLGFDYWPKDAIIEHGICKPCGPAELRKEGKSNGTI